MGTPRSLGSWKGRIELSLAGVTSVSIYVTERNIGIDGDTVGTIANDFAVLLVKLIEVEMSVAFPCLIYRIPVCDAS